jgi:hypothetical protein
VRIEDLRRGDLVKVDCAACHHVALLTPDFLLRLGLSPQAKVLDLRREFDAADAERGDEHRFGQMAATEHVSLGFRCGINRGYPKLGWDASWWRTTNI